MSTVTAIRRKLRAVLGSRKGMTLTELVITFLLTAIFFAVTCSLIAQYVNFHYHSQFQSYAQNITDMTLNRVTAELEQAQDGICLLDSNWDAVSLDTAEHEVVSFVTTVGNTSGGTSSYRELLVCSPTFYTASFDESDTIHPADDELALYGLCYLYRFTDSSKYVYTVGSSNYYCSDYTQPYSTNSYNGFTVKISYEIPGTAVVQDALSGTDRVHYVKVTVTVTGDRYGGLDYSDSTYVELLNQPAYDG